MRLFFSLWGLTALVSFVACGGHTITNGTDEGTGGTTSVGGAASNGGVPSRGGGSAGVGAASTAGSAGTGSSICACEPIACTRPGYTLVPDPKGCCDQCVCNPMLCPALACASSSHFATPPGECCPACVADSCEQSRAGYFALKQQLVDKYAYGCMVDSDCTMYHDSSPCNADCGVAVATFALDFLRSNLQGYSDQNCNGCQIPLPPCPARDPVCVNGRCQ